MQFEKSTFYREFIFKTKLECVESSLKKKKSNKRLQIQHENRQNYTKLKFTI